MKKSIFTCLIFLISFQSFSQTKSDLEEKPRPSYEFNVPLIRLIANPEKYDGKTIQVIGYLNLEFEGKAIYLHQEDYAKGLSQNGFWVDFSEKISTNEKIINYSKKYVIIVGKFEMNSRGHMSSFGGTFKNISRLDYWNIENK